MAGSDKYASLQWCTIIYDRKKILFEAGTNFRVHQKLSRRGKTLSDVVNIGQFMFSLRPNHLIKPLFIQTQLP